MARLRGTARQDVPVVEWQLGSTPPGAVASPDGLEGVRWLDAPGATTVAGALRAAGAWSLDGPARRFDAEDWWFRARLPTVAVEPGDELALCFDGLASVADVWLDGAPLFSSDNMFRAHERVVGAGARELTIRFRALDALLGAKRPRPRWRAPVVENQQLRWLRTTLLGRMPGWTPPAAPVGPWRGVRVERRAGFVVEDVRLRPSLAGSRGVLDVALRVRSLGAPLGRAELVVERGGVEQRAALSLAGGVLAGRLEIPDVERWWPHTHGEPALYAARLRLGDVDVPLGRVGFREIRREGDFALTVNGARVFCRGACWTPLDVVTLSADRAATRAALEQARDAGMNMLRVAGTFVYESDDFHDLLDELGILLWQELMFANMDYPEDDPAFVENVVEEARQQLGRLAARPSLAVVCGNSEVEQQTAMFGAARARWSPKLFHEVLPEIARAECPDVPYWPSSAHGGAFPHEANAGTTSYYGVGVYLRPLEDARRSEVKFATECLAFANPPEGIAPGKAHHPVTWPWRTPENQGAGWDFEDVRDHYLGRLYRVDAVALRYAEHDRYLSLGRAVGGELMAAVFGEWRRRRSTCAGGLVWFLRDLVPGPGWGVVDAAGAPKAPWWYLRRALAPVAAHVSDEGVNGAYVHLVNDTATPVRGELEVALYRAGELKVDSARQAVTVPARDALEVPALALFDAYSDLSYAYRFAPPAQDLLVATLRDGERVVAEAFYFPLGLPSARELDLGLAAEAETRADGSVAVTVRTRRFAQSVTVEMAGFLPDDAYFHLAPGSARTITMRRVSGSGSPRGSVRALNCEATSKIAFAASGG
jgi:beta-mannosidase